MSRPKLKTWLNCLANLVVCLIVVGAWEMGYDHGSRQRPYEYTCPGIFRISGDGPTVESGLDCSPGPDVCRGHLIRVIDEKTIEISTAAITTSAR